MTPAERYAQAIELFHQACDLPEGERRSFLAEACKHDPALHREAEALLRHDREVCSAVEAAEAGEGIRALSATALGDNEPAPVRIGRYRVLRKIGQGGMGMVFEAEQDHPQRTVALKVLHTGVGSAAMLSRFRREAELLGRLQHAGIAHVYEAGVGEVEASNGNIAHQPFFAMEFIQGAPLDTYARQRDLDEHARLELLARICDAVQHAHERGVIHRDLKPGNILVTPEGEPKVLDFGVSRTTDADVNTVTMRTDVGQLVGTIPYMSPEQVMGDPAALDERTDVYSLGVVLFELLAGRLPQDLRNRTIPEAVRIIREEEPTRLSLVDSALKGDPETIVSKALEKDCTHRYQSAGALATDIRRYLANEPILARPPSTFYQMRKFAVRNKVLVGGVMATILALIFGLSLALYGFVDARRQRDAARAEQKEKAAALRNEQAAREASDAVTDFFTETLAAADPAQLGRSVTVREVMDAAASRVGERFADKPLAEARIRFAISQTYVALGEYTGALEQAKPAAEIFRRIKGPYDALTLDAEIGLGEAYYYAGQLDHAISQFAAVLDDVRAMHERDDLRFSVCASNLAFGYMSTGRDKDAEPLLLEAISTREKAAGADDEMLIDMKGNLARLYDAVGRESDAENIYEDAIDRSRRLRGADHPQTALLMSNMAVVFAKTGREAEARALLEQALDIQKRVLGESHAQTLITLNNLTTQLLKSGEGEKALPLLRDALGRARKAYGETHPRTLMLIEQLGTTCTRLGRLDEAEPYLKEHLRLTKTVAPVGSDARLGSIQNLARLYQDRGDFEQAAYLVREALADTANADSLSAGRGVDLRLVLAECEVGRRRFVAAESVLLELEGLASNPPETADPDLARQAAEKRAEIEQQLADLYLEWDKAEPDAGHAAQAADWKAALDQKSAPPQQN